METSVLRRASPQVRKVMDLIGESENYNIQIYRKEGEEEKVLVFDNRDFNISKLRRGFGIPVEDALARIFLQVGSEESPIGVLYRKDEMHNKRVNELGDYLKEQGVEFNPTLAEFKK